MRRIRRVPAALVALLAAVAVACAGSVEAFVVDDQPEAIASIYGFVAANRALTEELVCYCGCGETLDHRHLRDCYWTDDGRPDSHGAGCGVCLAEASEAQRMFLEGMDITAIAEAIDQRFEASGPPTRAR
jgi:hypothetical protein